MSQIELKQKKSAARDRRYNNEIEYETSSEDDDDDVEGQTIIHSNELAQRSDVNMFDETVSSEDNETDIDIATSKRESDDDDYEPGDDDPSIVTGLTPGLTQTVSLREPSSESNASSTSDGLKTPRNKYLSKTPKELVDMTLKDVEEHCMTNANILQKEKNYRPFGVSLHLFCIRQ